MNYTKDKLKSITKQVHSKGRHRQPTRPLSGCKNVKCETILKEALPAHQLSVDHNHVFYPLPYHKFLELCCLCRNDLCDFWNDNNGEKKRISLELFRLDMEL